MPVPLLRIRSLNSAPVRAAGDYVLYWMIAHRRTTWHFGLQRAVELARQLGKPLLVFEPLRVDYRWASDRFHQFVIEGMADNAARCAAAGITYYPYLEPEPKHATGLLAALAAQACVVVSDDFPCFFLPALLRSVAPRLDVRLEIVDSNGLLPLRATEKAFARAVDFRRFLQRTLPVHLDAFPLADPFADYHPQQSEIPQSILRRWPAANPAAFVGDRSRLADFPIDHTVPPCSTLGGAVAAGRQLKRFVARRLGHYLTERNHPDAEAGSGLSPYLHFGHISAHEVFTAVACREGWKRPDITGKATGSADGWWGGSPTLEAFFDQLITWRELGYNLCAHAPRFARYETLPAWARTTLEEHERDVRNPSYSREELTHADTYDQVWNASQRELLSQGRIQNYLRMLWGKKILEWSPSPRDALATMLELNNRFALDGRNPNSYSGIFWVLGRYDRPWGPERPIFGKIRYMSSENTVRKLRMKKYLARFSGSDDGVLPRNAGDAQGTQ
jgi:deoxyribodipyrimidine photo-lyase